MAFLFWAICIGLSCGAQMYEIVFWGNIVIAVVLILFRIDIYHTSSYLLVVRGASDSEITELLHELLKKSTQTYKTRMQNFTQEGAEITMEIRVSEKQLKELQARMKEITQIGGYHIVAYNGEMVG